MSSKSRYVLFALVVAANLLVLMLRILSDFAASNALSTVKNDHVFALSFFRGNTSTSSFPSSPLSSVSTTPIPITTTEGAHTTHSDNRVTENSLHEQRSHPRAGVDAMLSCYNQSECIKPHLELKRDINVYLCRHSSKGGVRFYYLMRDGMQSHPRVHLVDQNNIASADYIVYLPNSGPWHKTECNDTNYANRLIVLDEYDLHMFFAPFQTKEERMKHYPVVDNTVVWNNLYFKRSYVRRKDGLFRGYPHLHKRDIYPLTYSIAEAYIQSPFNQQRDIDILCTLRGSKKQSTRLRVQENVQKYIDANINVLSKSVAKQLDGSSRKRVSHEYFARMHRAKIVVTVNPANWEGDFRLWEALSSGALVFVDPIMVPHPFPLVDGKHVIFFSQDNASDLFTKLDYYRTHSEEARRIAMAGYLHVMTFHRTANSVDYVFRTAEMKKAINEGTHPLPTYAYTGQYLVSQTKRQEKIIKKTKYPGHYETGSYDV